MNRIAIVGLGAILPGAQSVPDFWMNALACRAALRPPSAGARFDPALCASPGGYVVDAWEFDWQRFRIPPADASAYNPMHFVALSAAAEALAGVATLPRENTAVLLGASGLGFQKDGGLHIHEDEMVEALTVGQAFQALPASRRIEIVAATRRAFEAGLKECSSDNAVGTLASVAAGRIAMHFDLSGAHYAVDVDHASALAAVEIAARGLIDGEWDCVITGGVSELLTPLEWLAYEKMGFVSKAASILSFDARANGTLLGEGAALFVLKRFADAERDGDTIYAVLTGASVTSSPVATAPAAMQRHSALSRAMRSALADAGTDASGVQLVACDAPGVSAADAEELGALKIVYGERAEPLALRSEKPLVGHLRAASGAVSLLAATLALHHRTLHPQSAVRDRSAALDRCFTLVDEASPWPALPPGGVPRAAVTAISLSGVAAHLVLEGAARGGGGVRSEPSPASTGPRSGGGVPKQHEPIAILGIGGIYADAPNLEKFWENLIAGRDSVNVVPASRWPIDRYHSDDPARRERSIARMGSFVDLPRGGPEDGIAAAALPYVDPTHLLLLRAAEQAIEDTGSGAKRWNRRRVGAFVGYMPFQSRKFAADIRVNVHEFTAALKRALALVSVPADEIATIAAEFEACFTLTRPDITAHSLLGWLSSMMAARLARRYGFEGPCVAVESACASTLAAIHAAAQALRHGGCDVALAGASFCDIPVEFYVATSRFNALSPGGIHPFDASASGFVPGEGAGIFVLKRLVDAERDGDRVRAVLTAIGSSSDGKGGRSLLSPSVEGEALSMQRIFARAGVDPGSIDYVECHGTATPVGDAVESMALACSYGDAPRPRLLGIGSVKSNLGHLCAAAGAPALTKAVLAIERGEIPPSIHCSTPNPKIDFTAARAELLRERTPWPKDPERPRRAGVSTFGIGGTNFHAIVEEYRVVRKAPWTSFWVGGEPPDSTRGVSSSIAPGQLFAFAYESSARCLSEATSCLAQFRGGSANDFAEAARTTRAQATAGARSYAKVRLALTAVSQDDLARKIDTLGRTLASSSAADTLRGSGIFLNPQADARPRRPLVAVFPGLGPQYPNMLRQLAGHYPLVERILARADTVWQSLSGRTLRSALWTSQEHGLSARDEDMHGGMLAMSCSIAALMRFYGIRADVCVGQSAGELSALVTARVLSFEDALTAMHARTLAVLDLTVRDAGRMASVMCSAKTLREIIEGIEGKIVVAADNCPITVLASGETKAMEALSWRCAARGIEYIPFRVSHAYHSPVIAKAAARYRQVLETFAWNAPTAEVISTVDLAPYNADKREGVERLVAQYTSTVRLREVIEQLYGRGARTFFESGPRWTVTSYIRETLGKRSHIAHPSVHPKVGEVELFRRLLACAFTEGVGSLHPVRSDDTFEGPVSRADFDAAARRARSGSSIGIDFGPPPDDLMGPPSSRPAPASKGVAESVRIVFRKAGERREPVNPPNSQERLKDALITALAERTGYPKQMLELDLDLEGDLGIDTVKQVEVFTKVRQQFGLPRLEGTTLRDLNTLRKVIHHFEAQLRGEAPPAPVSSRGPQSVRGYGGASPVVDRGYGGGAPIGDQASVSSRQPRSSKAAEADDWSAPPSILPRPLTEVALPPPRAPTPAYGVSTVPPAPPEESPPPALPTAGTSFERIQAALLAGLSERTGYPTEMLDLDLDLEADLGIDTVKQVEVVAKVRAQFNLPRAIGAIMRDFNTLRKIVQSLATQLDETSAVKAEAQPRPEATPEPKTPRSGHLDFNPPPPPAPPATPARSDTGSVQSSAVATPAAAPATSPSGPPPSGASTGSAAPVSDTPAPNLAWETAANLEASGPISVRGSQAGRGSDRRAAPRIPAPKPSEPRPADSTNSLIVAGARVSTLQRVVERAEGRLVADALFSSSRNRYLQGIRLAGRPSVPISMAWEALAEAAELLDSHRVTSIVDLRSHRPLFLDERGERWVSVEATSLGPGRVRATLTSGEHEGPMIHQEGIFLTGGAPEVDVPRNVISALKHGPRASAGPTALAFRPLHLGETLGGAVWARALSFCELIGGISAAEESLITGKAEPAFILSPAVLESSLMLAGFGWYSLTGLVGVPVEIERTVLGREPVPHEELPCHLRLRRGAGTSVTADLTVLGADGAAVMKMIGLRLMRLDVHLAPQVLEQDAEVGEARSWDQYRAALEEAIVER